MKKLKCSIMWANPHNRALQPTCRPKSTHRMNGQFPRSGIKVYVELLYLGGNALPVFLCTLMQITLIVKNPHRIKQNSYESSQNETELTIAQIFVEMINSFIRDVLQNLIDVCSY